MGPWRKTNRVSCVISIWNSSFLTMKREMSLKSKTSASKSTSAQDSMPRNDMWCSCQGRRKTICFWWRDGTQSLTVWTNWEPPNIWGLLHWKCMWNKPAVVDVAKNIMHLTFVWKKIWGQKVFGQSDNPEGKSLSKNNLEKWTFFPLPLSQLSPA